jgi:hypothetical protein
MIIVRLAGGLGNQFFQYAAARAVAARFGTEVKVDISKYSGPTAEPDRKFELNKFRCNPAIASKEEIQVRADPRIYFLPDFGYNKQPFLGGYDSRTHYVESRFTFDPTVFEISKEHFLEGYFQSPRYFEGIRDCLMQDFKLTKPISPPGQEVLDSIESSDNPICLHIRRGDYVTNPTINKAFGVCSADYYANAVQIMISRLQDPQLFVFSDDTEWCKANLRFDVPMKVIDCNKGDAPSDIELMTRCKHFISANSTFSWWAAWLGSTAESVVICPRNYYASMRSTADLVPSHWIRLEDKQV